MPPSSPTARVQGTGYRVQRLALRLPTGAQQRQGWRVQPAVATQPWRRCSSSSELARSAYLLYIHTYSRTDLLFIRTYLLTSDLARLASSGISPHPHPHHQPSAFTSHPHPHPRPPPPPPPPLPLTLTFALTLTLTFTLTLTPGELREASGSLRGDLTYLRTYVLTYLRTYVRTYLLTYVLTYLLTYRCVSRPRRKGCTRS